MIVLRELTKCYGEKTVVDRLSFEVRPGEVFAFLGPNGAGKTTTIKILAGLVRPTAGAASIGGHDIVREALAAKAMMSYVPDEPYLYDKLTGREFLRLIGDLYAIPRQTVETQIAELSRAFDLEDFLDELCEGYSHGMKQRVVIASSLLHAPKVLVLDEPTVGLDPKTARALKRRFRALAQNEGVSVFMSTHSLSLAEEVADRIGILHQGRLVALGTLEELRLLQRQHGLGERSNLEELFLCLTDGRGVDDER